MNRIKKFLVASEENNYKPGLLKPKNIAIIAGFFLLSAILNNIFFNRKPASALDLTETNILTAVNNERELRNILTLNTDSRLTKAAEYKAQDMINRKYFSHTDPQGNYIWGTIVADGYSPYLQLGENLAIDFDSTESLVAAWMNSPTHRANLLNENFKDQGMGVSFGNTANGEYSSSIANTFGALLITKKETPAPAPSPAPAAPPAPKPTPPQPKPTPKPTPKPVPTPAPLATSTPEQPAPATSTPAQQKIAIQKDSLKVASNIKGATQILDMSVAVEGNPDTVAVSIADYTTLLSSLTTTAAISTATPATFTGQIELPLRTAGEDDPVQIFAQDRYGQSDVFKTSLQKIAPLPHPQDAGAVVQTPDQQSFNFYRFNRYAALVLGIILLIFMAMDVRAIVQKRIEHLDKKINNLVLLILSIIVIAALYWL